MKDKSQKLKPGQLYWLILEVIVLGVLSGGGSPLRPTLPLMFKRIGEIIHKIKQINIDEEKIKKTLQNLEKRELITLIEQNEDIYVQLKVNNNLTVFKYSIKALLDLKKAQKKWDGRWFLVFFDVPEIQRNKRDYLRRFLSKVGFYRYQKSVYLYPFECENEINLIKKIVEGAKYMKYIIAEKIEDEVQIRSYFNLI